jgi:hypothetical protein
MMMLIAAWAAWSLARAAGHAKRTADAMEALLKLARKGRQ